jgi:hypothetical protein
MRGKLALTLAAGAVLFLGGTARADSCPDRISQLQRNVAKYERDGRWNDARKERAKLAQTRANCGYDRRWNDDNRRDRDDRWRGNNPRNYGRHDNGRHNGWYKNNRGRWERDRDWRGARYDFDDRWLDHYRDSRWRDRDGRNLSWFRNNGYFWHDNHWCRH